MRNRPYPYTLRILILHLFLFAAVSAAAAAQTTDAAANAATLEHARTAPLEREIPIGPGIVAGRFDNGFRYLIRENRTPENRAELRLVVNAGSVLEDDDQLGLAHLLEHMAFNGSENFEKRELIAFMESIGMRLGPGLNASTSFDETIYMLQLPTDNPEYLAQAFRILGDWTQGLSLEEEDIDQERGVVIEEWRLGRGAATRVRDQQFPVLFQDSRYAERLPIGTLESIQSFEYEAVRRFYQDWYRPDLMGVIAVGDFDAAAVESLMRSHFAGLPQPAAPRPRPLFAVPDHEETLFAIASDPELTSTTISVYHKLDHEEDGTVGGYRRNIVEGLYNGMLNRRFSEMARQADPPFLGASSAKGRLVRSKGAYVLSVSVLEGGIDRGVAALFVEAERVARFGFTESELEREKTDLLRSVERSFVNRTSRTSSSIAAEYIRALLDAEPIPGIEYEFELYKRFLPEITLDEVNRVGRDWIREENRVVFVSGPAREGMNLPDAASLAAVLDSVEDYEITPYVDTVGSEPLLAELPESGEVIASRSIDAGITEWTLDNGIRVVLKPTDFQEDQIVFRAFRPGGTSLASDEDYVPAMTAATLIGNGGLGAFNSTDLQKVLTGTAASASPFISTYEEGLTGSASPADIETMFQLIYLRFTAPRPDATIFDLWSLQNRQSIANRDANPATEFNDVYNRIMTRDHPRERPPTLELIDRADLDESLSFYRERFGDASGFTFVFIGNMDLDVMRPFVEVYLGGLPSTGAEHAWRDIGLRRPSGAIEETVRRGIEPQSQTRIAFNGALDFESQRERTGLSALALMLETRLRDVLREDLGGTYSVTVGLSTGWRPEHAYTLTVSFGSDPGRSDELIAGVFREIESVKASGFTETEIASARQTLLRSFETSLRQNNFWLNQLVADYQRGADPGASVATYVDSLETITSGRMVEAANQYLNTENYVRVTRLPE